MASEKTPIIETLFKQRYRAGRGIPRNRRVVTALEVQAEIQAVNQAAGKEVLSDRNPANFLKDLVRYETRNANFPSYVVQRGWTARQVTGRQRSFEFVPLPQGQAAAFPVLAPPRGQVARPVRLQSLSLVKAARRYGRADESWLTEVVTDLAVVQTHLALHSRRDLVSLARLASHIKLGTGEADALYYGESSAGDPFLVACEMKGEREVLDEDQILRVAQAVQDEPGTRAAGADVIPVGVKVVWPGHAAGRKGLIWTREYDTRFPPLTPVSEQVYELLPAVPGIG